MKKVLIWGVTLWELTQMIEWDEILKEEGFEVGWSTNNTHPIHWLAKKKVLVVKPKTYDYDVLITMQKITLPPQAKNVILYDKQSTTELLKQIGELV